MQEAEYRLLVLDWMMPKMDGMELCRRVREMPNDRYTYIILLTGRTDRRDRLEALEGGADDFLTKPLDQAELMARLKAADRILSSDEALRHSNHELQLARNKELSIGAHIQRRLLYSPPPTSVSAIRTATLSIPSQSVDGDFCDFFQLGDSIVDLVVGDVMGKGVSAAMVGAGVKTSLQRCLLGLLTKKRELPGPAAIVKELDTTVCGELIELNTFLTLCYARFDAENAKMQYVNCGHPKIVHWQAQSGTIQLLDPTAVPLGFSEQETYTDQEISLGTGDLVLFYSDGITDLRTPSGGRLGTSGFAEWVAPRAHLALSDLTAELAQLRNDSPGGEAIRDDFTCVAIRYVGKEEPTEIGLSLWAHAGALRKVRDYVMQKAAHGEFNREEMGQIQLAVQEAASNAVRHARPGHSAIPIEALAECRDGVLRIELRYPGGPFDLSQVPAPSLDGSRDGGFGIAIIQRCMDKVEYLAEGDENRLVLVKTARSSRS
jgi:sigma-B regulation protein RsbU (phosphoserine phosphatase)